MFIGEYKHTIDTKKRVAIPAKFRKYIGQRVVVTRGLDSCLFIYPLKEWEVLAENLSKLPTGKSETRSFVRIMLAGAVDTDVDALGRILLPDYLRTYAGLAKKVIIAGVYNRIEVWDEEKWIEYKSKAEQSTEDVAEKLGDLGAY